MLPLRASDGDDHLPQRPAGAGADLGRRVGLRVRHVEFVDRGGGGSPPSTSASAPSTANNGAGPCTQAAIQAAVNVGRPKDQLAVVHAGDFACDGTWAVTAAVIPANREQVTVLLYWTGRTWQGLDRQVYCNNGQIPAALRTRACQSN